MVKVRTGKTITMTKDGLHFIDAWELSMNEAFGQNWNEKYGQGKYTKVKLDADVPGKKAMDSLDKSIEKLSLGDTFAKDMCMVALAPVSLAINGATQTAKGLIKMGFNLLPALVNNPDSKMTQSIAETALGIGVILLAAVAPMARLFNAASRVLAKGAGAELPMVPEADGKYEPTRYADIAQDTDKNYYNVSVAYPPGASRPIPGMDGIDNAYRKMKEVRDKKYYELTGERLSDNPEQPGKSNEQTRDFKVRLSSGQKGDDLDSASELNPGK